MIRRRLRWLCGAVLAGSTFLAPGPVSAQQQKASAGAGASDAASLRIQEGFDSATKEAFSQSFPRGKFSVVDRQLRGTASLLTTAHEYALEGKKERAAYRDALVYQTASRLALEEERFAEAMYLTFHARSIGRGVIRANTTRLPKEYQPDNLELIRRAGGVEDSEVEDVLERAEEEVPELEVLFVEDD